MKWNATPEGPDSEIAQRVAKKKEANPYCVLTPEEEHATFDLAPGYVAELVIADPAIEEPVLETGVVSLVQDGMSLAEH